MNLNEGNKGRNGISDGDLLQANATVFAGTLIFLTISSLTEGLVGGFSSFLIVPTALIVIPFSISSVIIISERKPKGMKASSLSLSKQFTKYGFGYLVSVLVILAYDQFNPPLFPIYTPAEKCAINPENYNITHTSDCSKFMPGSLAQDCALHPEKFHVELKQCSKFITR